MATYPYWSTLHDKKGSHFFTYGVYTSTTDFYNVFHSKRSILKCCNVTTTVTEMYLVS